MLKHITIHNEPSSYNEASKDPNSLQAMKKETEALQEN